MLTVQRNVATKASLRAWGRPAGECKFRNWVRVQLKEEGTRNQLPTINGRLLLFLKVGNNCLPAYNLCSLLHIPLPHPPTIVFITKIPINPDYRNFHLPKPEHCVVRYDLPRVSMAFSTVFCFTVDFHPVFLAYFFSSSKHPFPLGKKPIASLRKRKWQMNANFRETVERNAYEICNQITHTHTSTHNQHNKSESFRIPYHPAGNVLWGHFPCMYVSLLLSVRVRACACVCVRNKWVQHAVEDLSRKMQFQASFSSGNDSLWRSLMARYLWDRMSETESKRKFDWSGRGYVCVGTCISMCVNDCLCVWVCSYVCVHVWWMKEIKKWFVKTDSMEGFMKIAPENKTQN